MIKVKLLPRGKKHQITYRIVIAEDRSKMDGKFIDDLGFYTPQTKALSIDKEKLIEWQKKGAQLTTGVDKLLNPDKYPNKKKVKKTTDKAPQVQKESGDDIKTDAIKEEIKNEGETKPEETPTSDTTTE